MPGPGEPGDPVVKPDPDEDELEANTEQEIKKQEDRRAVARRRIADKHVALGASGFALGSAVSDVRNEPGGFSQQFQRGAIFVRDGHTVAAFEVHGLIAAKYSKLGGPGGFLGYPTSDERDPFGLEAGRMSSFEGGTIFWRRGAPEAFEVHGAIGRKYALPLARTLGYPRTDETATSDGAGRFNHFERGSIFWHPNIGPHEVHGAIHGRYQQLGFERSQLGYPTSDEQDMPGGKVSHFENGRIEFTPQTGARPIITVSARRISVIGTAHNRDFEGDIGGIFPFFPRFEEETGPIHGVAVVDRINVPVPLVVGFAEGTGGELRSELDLTVEVNRDAVAIVTGEARLFEGTSQDTGDLETVHKVDLRVAPGGKVHERFTLENQEFASPDDATFDLIFTNVEA